MSCSGCGELPLPTQVILAADGVFRHHTIEIIAAAIVSSIMLFIARKTPATRLAMDSAMLEMPLFGRTFTTVLASQFTGTLFIMLRCGMPPSQALLRCEELFANRSYRKFIAEVREATDSGIPLSQVLIDRQNFVPGIEPILVAHGTASPPLRLLDETAMFYRNQTPRTIRHMLGILNPAILVGTACVVLFLASAIMLPMYQMISNIGANPVPWK